MPFSLRLARAQPIPRQDFHALFSRAPGDKRGEDLYWVTGQGEAWFAAELEDGVVRLSISLGHPRFVRLFTSLLGFGLDLARDLGASLVEEAGGQTLVDRAAVERLLEGAYLQQQLAAFREVQRRIDAEGQAPLDFPLSGVDLVPEYLLFHVRGGAARPLELGGKGLVVVQPAPGAWAVREPGDDGEFLTRVLRRPDGVLQIWPAWQRSAFPRIAEVTLATAERVLASVGGELHFLGTPCDTRRRAEIRAQARGFSADFYEWTQDQEEAEEDDD